VEHRDANQGLFSNLRRSILSLNPHAAMHVQSFRAICLATSACMSSGSMRSIALIHAIEHHALYTCLHRSCCLLKGLRGILQLQRFVACLGLAAHLSGLPLGAHAAQVLPLLVRCLPDPATQGSGMRNCTEGRFKAPSLSSDCILACVMILQDSFGSNLEMGA